MQVFTPKSKGSCNDGSRVVLTQSSFDQMILPDFLKWSIDHEHLRPNRERVIPLDDDDDADDDDNDDDNDDDDDDSDKY